jgi:hypothetical protein
MTKDTSKISNTYIPPHLCEPEIHQFSKFRVSQKQINYSNQTYRYFFPFAPSQYVGMYILPFTAFHFLLLV